MLLPIAVCAILNAQNSFNWVQQTPNISPPGRTGHALAYDAARGQIVMFGGANNVTTACAGGCPPYLNDTWVWDGSVWTHKFPRTFLRRARA